MKLVMAEFVREPDVLLAARELKRRGCAAFDSYTPYPVHGLEELMGYPRSRLGWVAFVCGLAGFATAYLIQWWTSAIDYPLEVGARPPHAPLSFIPICFETTILAAASGMLAALFFRLGLPRLWQPVFETPGFESATRDAFWLGVDAAALPRPALDEILTDAGAVRVVWPEAA